MHGKHKLEVQISGGNWQLRSKSIGPSEADSNNPRQKAAKKEHFADYFQNRQIPSRRLPTVYYGLKGNNCLA